MTEKKNFQHIPFFCLLCLTLSVFLTGCAKKKQPAAPGTGQTDSQPSANTDTPSTNEQSPVTLDEILRLFDDEKAEEAVEQFLRTPWSASGIFEDGSIFSITHQQFVEMPQSQRDVVQKQAMKILNSLRALATQITSQGNFSINQKNYALAEQNLSALLQLGEILSQKDRLDIVRSYGILLRQMSLRPLMQIYTETSQQAKLDETKAKIQKIRTERRALVR